MVLECRMDRMFAPVRRFKPDHAVAMAAAGEEIRFAVAVQVARVDIGRADLVFGDDMFFPGFGRIARRFPPGKVVSAWRWFAFGAGRGVGTSIAVDIPKAEVMREAGSVFIGEGVGLPVFAPRGSFGIGSQRSDSG